MKRTILFVCTGFLVGVAAFLVWQWVHAPITLNQDLYPLYSGVRWGAVKASSVEGAAGAEVLSEPIVNITNIAASSTPFTEYYKNKLTGAGWAQDMSKEAGGPGAEVSVYTKGREFIIVTFTTTFHTKPANAPESCPCDLQLGLISGATK